MSEDLRRTFKTHAGCVPTNWCDSLLTGPDACLPAGKCQYTPKDIERLLLGIKNRIEAFEDEGTLLDLLRHVVAEDDGIDLYG